MDKDLPLVSVIITTYNRKNIVGLAIQGVLDQNYPNIEIIVVDDCSSDGTEEYFASNWVNKIKYIRHKKNMGVQFASNTGYDHSSGKFLAFIGDDDRWSYPDKLKEQIEIFEKDNISKYGIVTTSVHIIRENEEFDKIIKHPKNILKHLLARNGIIYGSAALIRRDAFEYAGKFAEELPKGTDSDVFRRIVILGYDAYFIEKPMIDYYELGNDRMTGANHKALVRSIKGEMYKLRNYSQLYSQNKVAESKVLHTVGNLYYQLYSKNFNAHNKTSALKFYIKSFMAFPLNYRALSKFLQLLWGMR